jgi:FtsZ-binding cell division protein ZapB
MENDFDYKIKYAQNIINVLQTKLNESIAQNVQLEATVTMLKDDKEKLTKELADDSSNKTKKE